MRTRLTRARLIRRVAATLRVISALLGILTVAPGLIGAGQEGQSALRSSGSVRREALGRMQARVELAVADYNDTIGRVMAGRGSVEQAFAKVHELEHLLIAERDEDHVSALERMSEIELAQFAVRLPGVRLWSSDTIGVEIDPAFFQDLAEKHGTAADRMFVRNYRLTYPIGYGWPDYVEPVTDLSGCTTYGGGELTNAYARWSTYASRYPGHYATDVGQILEDVSNRLIAPVCACGDAGSVRRELSNFVTRLPNEQITPKVRRRLKAIAAGQTSEIRFNCLPG